MSEIVEYDQLVAFLRNASLHEIYRISTAIERELDNPQRILAVKAKIREGDYVEYFDCKTNVLTRARVLKKQQKKVLVQNCDDMRHWVLPYYWLKIDSREFNFRNPDKKGLHKNELSVGQWVGFTSSRNGDTVVGRVKRLNQKTVSLTTAQGAGWLVSYSVLYTIIDGEADKLAPRDGLEPPTQ